MSCLFDSSKNCNWDVWKDWRVHVFPLTLLCFNLIFALNMVHLIWGKKSNWWILRPLYCTVLPFLILSPSNMDYKRHLKIYLAIVIIISLVLFSAYFFYIQEKSLDKLLEVVATTSLGALITGALLTPAAVIIIHWRLSKAPAPIAIDIEAPRLRLTANSVIIEIPLSSLTAIAKEDKYYVQCDDEIELESFHSANSVELHTRS